MEENQRAEVLLALRVVDEVLITDHVPNDPDPSVCRALLSVRPAVFANGGDRKDEVDIPEVVVCRENGIKMVFNVGFGGKVQSSSELAAKVRGRA